MIKCNK